MLQVGLTRLLGVLELPPQLRKLFKAGAKALPAPETLHIHFSTELFLRLFRSLKQFRARLPASYLALGDFKLYFLAPGLPPCEFLRFACFVFRLLHGPRAASEPRDRGCTFFWSRERVNGVLLVLFYKARFRFAGGSADDSFKAHLKQIESDFAAFCAADSGGKKAALQRLLSGIAAD